MNGLIILLVTLGIVFTSVFVFAEVPNYMQFQGKATNAQDEPLNGDNYSLTFRIYDAETAGNLLWNETHAQVSIENGVFSVLLGGVTPLDLVFDNPYWISTEIDGLGELPRMTITSVGYAYSAKEAEHAVVADTLSEFVIENRTSDPENPKPGQIWLRTDL